MQWELHIICSLLQKEQKKNTFCQISESVHQENNGLKQTNCQDLKTSRGTSSVLMASTFQVESGSFSLSLPDKSTHSTSQRESNLTLRRVWRHCEATPDVHAGFSLPQSSCASPARCHLPVAQHHPRVLQADRYKPSHANIVGQKMRRQSEMHRHKLLLESK